MVLPKPPEISSELLARCQASDDFAPILFEWYKFTGALANFCARIERSSAVILQIDIRHWSVLIGLINRCSRLMLSNVKLSADGLFGETTGIIDRCIFESAVKVRYVCRQRDAEKFERLIRDGLKTEVELKKIIEENIKERNGIVLPIEARMLTSIQSAFDSAKATEIEIAASPRVPDLAAMIEASGGNRLEYVVGQRLGSHHTHGTWVSLKRDYLVEENETVMPKDHESRTDQNQYLFGILVVLEALEAFVDYAFIEGGEKVELAGLFSSIRDEVIQFQPD